MRIEHLNRVYCVFACRRVHVVGSVDFSVSALADQFQLFEFGHVVECERQGADLLNFAFRRLAFQLFQV